MRPASVTEDHVKEAYGQVADTLPAGMRPSRYAIRKITGGAPATVDRHIEALGLSVANQNESDIEDPLIRRAADLIDTISQPFREQLRDVSESHAKKEAKKNEEFQAVVAQLQVKLNETLRERDDLRGEVETFRTERIPALEREIAESKAQYQAQLEALKEATFTIQSLTDQLAMAKEATDKAEQRERMEKQLAVEADKRHQTQMEHMAASLKAAHDTQVAQLMEELHTKERALEDAEKRLRESPPSSRNTPKKHDFRRGNIRQRDLR